ADELVAERDRRIRQVVPDLDISSVPSKCRGEENIECMTFSFFDNSARLSPNYPMLSGIVASEDNGVWLREYPHDPADSVRWVHVTPAGRPDKSILLAVDDSLEHAGTSDLLVSNKRHKLVMRLLHFTENSH
ncbi:MAG TPA: hypothetical protein VII02_10285, partial [Gemmatimonadaceae bacterium]